MDTSARISARILDASRTFVPTASPFPEGETSWQAINGLALVHRCTSGIASYIRRASGTRFAETLPDETAFLIALLNCAGIVNKSNNSNAV
jgi:hypothetical protein